MSRHRHHQHPRSSDRGGVSDQLADTAAGADAAQPPTQAVATATAPERKEMPAEWPTRGYDGPQAWEASNPPELSHDRGLLTSGEVGEDVIELCSLLATLGIETSISRGQNPHAVFDDSVRAGLDAFRSSYNVLEDPQVVAATIPAVVGPYTWEALFRAAAKAEAEADAGEDRE